jgi:oxygen-independent coproporphyrinogen-3 oxidase
MTPKNPEAGLYIHIPFCHARCGYCDFVTFTGQEDRIGDYVEALCREIELYAQIYPALSVPTLFFGGGTPSLLEPHHVERVLRAVHTSFTLKTDAEITMEANPESVTAAKTRGWKAAGVNRLSIGLQAFDDRLLRAMGRLHTVEEFLNAYEVVRAADFDNVNVDLIYGFPEQSLADWQKTLAETVRLMPEHMSLYALKVEEHTPFHRQGVIVDDDRQADMYAWARTFLKENGYPQYEISNFARPGRACRHNLIYWRQEDYLGLGVGAVGCVKDARWENHKNLLAYTNDVSAGRLPHASIENLDEKTRRFERLMLGLRLREGIVWEEKDPLWLDERRKLSQCGWLEELAPDQWRISETAIPLTNQILLPFI